MIIPPPGRAAFLLDLDGTLLDIAARPDAVVVDPGLPASLRTLRARCGDALAIVTGRSLREVDALLPGAAYAVAAEHGTVIRHAPHDMPVTSRLDDPPDSWIDAGVDIMVAHPGTSMERKQHGFVLHYRNAPGAGPSIETALRSLLAGSSAFTLLAAKMAWEIRPTGVDKGVAVRAIMDRPPFAGRLPVYIGDDITDEDGIAAAEAMGGLGLRVADAFGEPADVRAWLAGLASDDHE